MTTMDFRFTTLYYNGWEDDMREVYGWPQDEDPVDEDDPQDLDDYEADLQDEYDAYLYYMEYMADY